MEKSRLGQVLLPAAVVLVVAVMVIPLPSSVLDVLIVANLSTAVLILLVSMNVKRALDFSSFPSLLLVVTLLRLGLNVATSRAVLSNGHAGEVIATFGPGVFRNRGDAHAFLLRTGYMFQSLTQEIREGYASQAAEFDLTVQTQGLFNGSLPGVPASVDPRAIGPQYSACAGSVPWTSAVRARASFSEVARRGPQWSIR